MTQFVYPTDENLSRQGRRSALEVAAEQAALHLFALGAALGAKLSVGEMRNVIVKHLELTQGAPSPISTKTNTAEEIMGGEPAAQKRKSGHELAERILIFADGGTIDRKSPTWGPMVDLAQRTLGRVPKPIPILGPRERGDNAWRACSGCSMRRPEKLTDSGHVFFQDSEIGHRVGHVAAEYEKDRKETEALVKVLSDRLELHRIFDVFDNEWFKQNRDPSLFKVHRQIRARFGWDRMEEKHGS